MQKEDETLDQLLSEHNSKVSVATIFMLMGDANGSRLTQSYMSQVRETDDDDLDQLLAEHNQKVKLQRKLVFALSPSYLQNNNFFN